ncbi:MAG: universal stress protein [Sphingobacteriales bacterium]|nr:MAG: universal stress protein [Sphingobacteriales bacterium]
MKKIFLPTDFSDIANNSAHLAAYIARKSGSSIFLFHIMSIPLDWDHLSVEQEKQYPEFKAMIANTKKQLSDYASSDFLKGIKVDWEVFINDTLDNIVNHADSVQSDMIVMGTHGSKGFNELVLGSNTQKIVRLAKMPVLTVNKFPRHYQLNDIALFSDFNNADEYQRLLDRSLELANIFGSTIHLVKVLTPADDLLDFEVVGLEGYRSNKKIKKEVVRIDYLRPVEEGIFNYIDTHKVDLIVMGTHGRTGLARLIMGSVAEIIVNHSPVPVLTYKV